MDLKDWQKISEDEHSVTMKHGKGHTMTIAVKALPRIQQEAIRRLKFADGGGVSEQGKDIRYGHKMKRLGDSDKAEMSKDMAKEEAKGRAAEERHVKPNLKGLSKGGIAKFADGTPEEPVEGPQAAAAPEAPLPVNPMAELNKQPVNVEAPEAMQPVPETGPNGSMNPAAILENTKRIGNAQQQVDTAKGKAESENERLQAEALAKAAEQRQNSLNDLTVHTKTLGEAASKGQINPNAYFQNMHTPEKVTTALGLFLGGLSVPFGGHNYAQDFLDKQIDRDIDGQKARWGQQKTVLEAYQHLYGENATAEAATRAGLREIYKARANQVAAQLQTPQAAINNAKFQQEQTLKQSKDLQDAAVNIGSLPGYGAINKKSAPAGSMGGGNTYQQMQNGQGSSGSWGKDESANTDRVLTPEAHKKYDWVMSKYNHVMTDAQKSQIQQEYQNAFQTDKALNQIDELYPELMKKRTYGGYLANKIDPNTFGAGLGAATEALGLAGALPTGGGSLAAALPAALAATAGGVAGGHIMKQGLRAMGGQDQTQYETAANSLESIVASALPGLTPTERGGIAKEFLPTKFDSDKTAADKLHKLKQKLISLTKTPALDSAKMTRQGSK